MRLKLTAFLIAFMAIAMPLAAEAQTAQGRFARIGAGIDNRLDRANTARQSFTSNVNRGLNSTGRFLGRAAMAPLRLGARGVAAIQRTRAVGVLQRANTTASGAALIREDARETIHAARETRDMGRANIATGQDRIAAARAGSSFLSRINPFSSTGRAARAEIRMGRQQISAGRAQLRDSQRLGRQGLATRQVAVRAQQRANGQFDRASRIQASADRFSNFANGGRTAQNAAPVAAAQRAQTSGPLSASQHAEFDQTWRQIRQDQGVSRAQARQQAYQIVTSR